MKTIGLIAEYNPFHNGHKYQIDKIKEKYPDSTIIVVISGCFTERGEISILNKWDKASLALEYGCDLVVELPFIFSTQSSDIFAKGAVEILNSLNIDTLIFGSESNDLEKLTKVACTQLYNETYDLLVKTYLDEGYNYPTSMNKALEDCIHISINEPNDLLGISYIKEVFKQNKKIDIEIIKRTNSYHSKDLKGKIASATAIRNALKKKKDISKYVPDKTVSLLKHYSFDENKYFQLLKYKILSSNDLSIYVDVDEGIEYRIKRFIKNSNSLDDFINKVKTKRYTYNKIQRTLIHILCDFTKDIRKKNDKISYLRILGLSRKGRKHLNSIKKDIIIPILSKYSNILDYEMKICSIYSLLTKEKNDFIQQEYKNHPIIKK